MDGRKGLCSNVATLHAWLTGAGGEAEEAVGRTHGEEAGGDLPPRGVAH